MRTKFVRTLTEIAADDPNMILLTGDLGFSVFEEFAAEFTNQFYDVGVAEAAMIGIASGLALAGKKVFAYSIVPFVTMRCYEQIRVDLCYQNLNVILVGVGGGFAYGPQGATHHALEDIAVMRALPNMTVLCPADPFEAESATFLAYQSKGPSYIRLGKNGEPSLPVDSGGYIDPYIRMIAEGSDITILATGPIASLALEVCHILRRRGIGAAVYSMNRIKPMDEEFLSFLAQKGNPVFTVEEHSVIGGLGSAVGEFLAEYTGPKILFKRFGIRDSYSKYVGSQRFLRSENGLDPSQIAHEIRQLTTEHPGK